MAYNLENLQELSGRRGGSGGWYPGKLFREGLGKVGGAIATKIRRPVGYEVESGHKNVRAPQEETNWSDRIRGPLYRGLFNLDKGSDIYNIDEQGVYSFNPDNPDAKLGQQYLDESFQRAKESGELFSHPDLPDSGKVFYKAHDNTLGDAYFDKEGNVIDYWNIGLDEGEKVWGGLGSAFDKDRKFLNVPNLLRAVVDPFTSPKTFKGKAGGGDFTGEPVTPAVDTNVNKSPLAVATDPRQLARTIDVSNPESVMAFQKATGLTPDGRFGPKTLAKLREIQGA